MEYLVIELREIPHIVAIHDLNEEQTHIKVHSSHNLGGDPAIFKDKNTAFRVANECKQGLVYPIVDIMKTMETIKLKYKHGTYDGYKMGMNDILTMLDEII
jgi:hypothetical protein